MFKVLNWNFEPSELKPQPYHDEKSSKDPTDAIIHRSWPPHVKQPLAPCWTKSMIYDSHSSMIFLVQFHRRYYFRLCFHIDFTWFFLLYFLDSWMEDLREVETVKDCVCWDLCVSKREKRVFRGRDTNARLIGRWGKLLYI